MREHRYVPPTFTFAGDDKRLNILLHELVELFPTSERTDDYAGICRQATDLLQAYLVASTEDPLATARRMLQFPGWVEHGDEWDGAVFSSMGEYLSRDWVDSDEFKIALHGFLWVNQLVVLTIEERGPYPRARNDIEAGGVVQSPTHGRIVYIHPKHLQSNALTRVYPTRITVVPLVPPEGTPHIRTQPNGTRIYELDLRIPRIDY